MGREEGADELLTRLQAFWSSAELPADRWPYFAFQSRRYPSILVALRDAGALGSKRILDLGGGVGGLAVSLRPLVQGTIDLADFAAPTRAHAAALTAAGVRQTHAVDLSGPRPLSELPTDYDLILFVEVLEHLLVNPILLFRELWTHLAPGGRVFLTTPNLARASNRVRLLRGRSIKERGRYPLEGGAVYGHVVEYTRDELDELFRVAGFDPGLRRIVQQPSGGNATAFRRLARRAMNSVPLRRFELGDDILAVYRRQERPVEAATDPSGRI